MYGKRPRLTTNVNNTSSLFPLTLPVATGKSALQRTSSNSSHWSRISYDPADRRQVFTLRSTREEADLTNALGNASSSAIFLDTAHLGRLFAIQANAGLQVITATN